MDFFWQIKKDIWVEVTEKESALFIYIYSTTNIVTIINLYLTRQVTLIYNNSLALQSWLKIDEILVLKRKQQFSLETLRGSLIYCYSKCQKGNAVLPTGINDWVSRDGGKVSHTDFAHVQVGHTNLSHWPTESNFFVRCASYISMLLTMHLFLHTKFH